MAVWLHAAYNRSASIFNVDGTQYYTKGWLVVCVLSWRHIISDRNLNMLWASVVSAQICNHTFVLCACVHFNPVLCYHLVLLVVRPEQ